MKKIISLFAAIALSGCAHNIKITPDSSQAAAAKSKTVVAYYISDADKKLKTTTPGGGGDKVSYELAKDMEYGFFGVLNNSYETVKVLNASHDVQKMKADGIAVVFEPKFTSKSSGSSLMFWPADKFSISVQCKVYNQNGDLILDKTIVGEGTATSGEVLSNFSIAANRAATDVLAKLKQELAANPALK